MSTISATSALMQRLKDLNVFSEPRSAEAESTFHALLDDAIHLLQEISQAPGSADKELLAFDKITRRWINYWSHQTGNETLFFAKLDRFYASLSGREKFFFNYLLRVIHDSRQTRPEPHFRWAIDCALGQTDRSIAEIWAAELFEVTLVKYQRSPSMAIVNLWQELGLRCLAGGIHVVAAQCFERIGELPVDSAISLGAYRQAAKAYENAGPEYYAKAANLHTVIAGQVAFETSTPFVELNYWSAKAFLYGNAAPPDSAQAADCYKKTASLYLIAGRVNSASSNLRTAARNYVAASSATTDELEKRRFAGYLEQIGEEFVSLSHSDDAADCYESAAAIYSSLSPSTIHAKYAQKAFESAAAQHKSSYKWLLAIACYEKCLQYVKPSSLEAAGYVHHIQNCWPPLLRQFLDPERTSDENLLRLAICQLLNVIPDLPVKKRDPLFVLLEALGPNIRQDVESILAVTSIVLIRNLSVKESENIVFFVKNLRSDVRDHPHIVQLLDAIATLPMPERKRMLLFINQSCAAIRELINLWREVEAFYPEHRSVLISFLEMLNPHPNTKISEMRELVSIISQKVAAGVALEPLLFQLKGKNISTPRELIDSL